MIHVGDIMSIVGVFSTVGYSINKSFFSHGTEHPHGTQDNPHGSHDIPQVTEHPHGTQDIPHGTHDIPHSTEDPHGTEHPHGTAHTLYRMRGIGIIFFRADDYTVVKETLGMKYGIKKTKESNKKSKSHGTVDLSFNLKLKLIVFFHFTVLCIGRSNCFHVINSFCSTGTLKVTITISFAKLLYSIFKACLNPMC